MSFQIFEEDMPLEGDEPQEVTIHWSQGQSEIESVGGMAVTCRNRAGRLYHIYNLPKVKCHSSFKFVYYYVSMFN